MFNWLSRKKENIESGGMKEKKTAISIQNRVADEVMERMKTLMEEKEMDRRTVNIPILFEDRRHFDDRRQQPA